PRNMSTGSPNELLLDEMKHLQMPYSPIFDFFPIRFHILHEGVIEDYEGHVHLPPIDVKRFEIVTRDKYYMTKKKAREYQIKRDPYIYRREEANFQFTKLDQETELVEMTIERVRYLS